MYVPAAPRCMSALPDAVHARKERKGRDSDDLKGWGCGLFFDIHGLCRNYMKAISI